MIHARNFARNGIADARLVAIADPAYTALQHGCQELGITRGCSEYRELLRDPTIHAVVVAAPSAYHCEIVVASARAGKHILCEKPMAMNVAESDAILAAVEQAGVKLQIGFMRRYDASFIDAKQRVDSGEIGRVVLVKSVTHGPTTPKPWMYDIRKSNGPLSEVNSHDIDTVRWFCNTDFEEVYAIAGNYRSPEAQERYPDFYDNVILSARLENGMQGAIAGAQGVQYGYDARCEILGEKGLVTVGRLATNSVTTHTVAGSTNQNVHSWMDLFRDAYRAEDEDFIRCILEDRQPRANGHDGKAAVMVVNAGNRSIVERRPVRLTGDREQ